MKHAVLKIILVLASCMSFGVVQAAADGIAGAGGVGGSHLTSRKASSPLFNKTEKHILGEYLRSHAGQGEKHAGKHPGKQKALPPGLRKKLERGGSLPPGWQKKLARGEVLDAGLYAQSEPLPRMILERLPPAPDGTSIRHIEDRVVRILNATDVILDVLSE